MNVIIAAVDKSPVADRFVLRDAMARVFGDERVTLREQTTLTSEFSVGVRPSDSTPFQIIGLTGGIVTVDGTFEQNLEAAAVVRSLLPEDAPRIVAFTADGDVYVDLPAGTTVASIANNWRPISEGGFEDL